jgi:hypothetical protein
MLVSGGFPVAVLRILGGRDTASDAVPDKNKDKS